MPSTLFISTSQIYTLIYLFAHLCYAASMVFFFSRTLSPRFFVRKPFLCSLPFLGILLLYTGITGDAQSPFFKIVFYCVALAANGVLYGTRFWRRMGNYFFIVICLGIVEFVATILYYPLIFLFHREIHSFLDPVVPRAHRSAGTFYAFFHPALAEGRSVYQFEDTDSACAGHVAVRQRCFVCFSAIYGQSRVDLRLSGNISFDSSFLSGDTADAPAFACAPGGTGSSR